MASPCAVHSKEPAVSTCFQCQKPLCKSCVMITPQGSFCGSECSVIYREFKQKQASVKKMGTATKVAIFMVLILGVFVVIHLGVRFGKMESLKQVDLIGALLPADPTEPKSLQNK